jgi:hypothetical protein
MLGAHGSTLVCRSVFFFDVDREPIRRDLST